MLDPGLGWRLGFLIGPVLALFILVLRRHLPESPRWQIMHGYRDGAETSISFIEHEVGSSGRDLPQVDQSKEIELRPRAVTATSICCACCSRPTRDGPFSAPR